MVTRIFTNNINLNLNIRAKIRKNTLGQTKCDENKPAGNLRKLKFSDVIRIKKLYSLKSMFLSPLNFIIWEYGIYTTTSQVGGWTYTPGFNSLVV
jgi:hypothetical protein